ncbi:MAG TPA: hypothetical protein DEA08_27360, partial [Planctomycetes bacterium]|nr:hypothetical protein [Planctomycetota bacterium]
PRPPAAVAVAWWRAEAQRTYGQLDDAVAAYEAFLAGKGFQLPAGEAASAELDALRASPSKLLERWTREGVFMIGEIRFSQRRFEDATKRYEEYVRRFPNGPRWSAAHAKIREAQFQRCLEAVTAKDYATARKRFDAFLAAHPLDGRAPRVLFLLGQLSVVEGEEFIEQAIKDPAKLALAKPRFEQAIADWARLVSKYPGTNESALALYRTGLLQEERLGQLETALETYRRVTWGSASSQARARIALLTRQQLKVTTERVFRSDETATIKLETRNLETLSVRQYFLSLEGYFRKHKQAGGVERLDIALIQPDKTWEAKVDDYSKYAPREQQLEVPFPQGKAGVCLIHVSGGDFEATTLVVKSDLELIFRVSREELLAFAQDARQGKAAAGVEVLASDGEKVFSLGKTGADGVLRKKHERLAQANDWRFFASLGDHSAASELSLSGLRNAVQLRPRAYLYTDRPAYQPGQTVHVKAVLRGVEQSSYALPKAKNYRVRLIDARGRAIDEELVAVTSFGTVCATFALDASVPVGTYRVVAGPEKSDEGPSASGTIQVQQFELRPLELELEAPRAVYQRGEVVELTAKARFSWGQPAADKQIVIDLPNGRREQGKTDAQGRFELKFDTTSQPPGGVVRFMARLPEEGVAASLEVFLPRLGFQTSVSTSQELVLAGEPVELRFSTKGPDGKPVGRKLNVFVQRREARKPDPVLNAVPWFRAPSGGSATRTVQEHQVSTDPKTGEARLSRKIEAGGDYVIRAVGEDRFGQPVVGESGLRVSDDEDGTRLRVFSESASLEVGQAHSVRLHSRLKAPTLALLTWEGDAVLAHRVVTLKPGFTSLETQVDHVHFPNFRLAVTALEEQKLHSAHKDFRVARELRVTLKPKQERYAPGETAEVELVVTDQLGRPVEAELSLALVEETLYARFPEQVGSIKAAFEEGVKRQAEFRVSASNAFRYEGKTSEILKAFKDEANRLELAKNEATELKELQSQLESERSFARGRAGGRRMRDARESLAKKMAPSRQGARPMPSPADAPAMEPSGGMSFDADDEADGGGEAAPRQDEIGAGFWKCEVVTDAQGRATISVPLPQRTTRWRLTTRGVSVATLVGEARSHVVTAKDFFVELLAPRHLREGDEIRLLSRVHGPKGAEVELELQLREGERYLASRRARATLSASGTAEVVFANLKVPAAEALELVLSGKSGQASDSLSRQVQVVPWGEEVVVHGGGTATGDASVVLRLPPGQLQSRWLSVMVGPSLEGTLAELALQRGNCWPESLGARLLGLASALRYARKHGADETTLQRLERALRRSLGAVAPTQQGNRGWGLGGGSVEETCFVLWGLAQSKGAIHFVPETQAAENLLLNAYRRTGDANLRTQILHALAEAGRADFRLANSLYRLRNRLQPAALARLALVFLKLDRRNFATELARALPRKVTGNTEVDAWQLLALARVTPGTPVAAELASQLLA